MAGEADALAIEVRNGPARSQTPGAQGGAGLAGVVERIRAARGELEAGPDGDGWIVRARLPLRPRCGGTPPARA